MAASRGTIDEGKIAALLGKHLSDNPYPEGCDDHCEWAEGHANITKSRSSWPRSESPTTKRQYSLKEEASQ